MKHLISLTVAALITATNATQDIRKFFQLGDANGDGVISQEEYFSLCIGCTKDQSNAFFAELDFDNDGYITQQEFLVSDGMNSDAEPTLVATTAAAAAPTKTSWGEKINPRVEKVYGSLIKTAQKNDATIPNDAPLNQTGYEAGAGDFKL